MIQSAFAFATLYMLACHNIYIMIERYYQISNLLPDSNCEPNCILVVRGLLSKREY